MQGQALVAGIDEAGRGPLAGPVFASAVILKQDFQIQDLADSKTLSAKKRERLAAEIKTHALSWSIAQASVEEIDALNILQATLLAMKRAVDGLIIKPTHVLIDGNQIPVLSIPCQAIVGGDKTITQISAASILAKVARDQLMIDYAQMYPQFSFQSHKGYGTKQHQAEIAEHGILSVHRRSFNPVKKMLQAALSCHELL
jgi:ribonuclease HII